MSLLRRRTLLRRFFAAMEGIASNVGLIREAGKEFRLFSHEVLEPAAVRRRRRRPCAAADADCPFSPALPIGSRPPPLHLPGRR